MLSEVESYLVSKTAQMRSCWSMLSIQDQSVLCRDVLRGASLPERVIIPFFPLSVSKNPSSVGHPKLQKLAFFFKSFLILLSFEVG